MSRPRLIFFLFLFIPNIMFNEIAWMGTKESPTHEWLELFNNSNNQVSLQGWSIINGKKLNIKLKGTIPAKGFFLLERNSDNSVPKIKADLIYKGTLNNKGEHLKLVNQEGIVDEIDCSSGWFAGDNKTKQTMARTDSNNWRTGNPTPKTKNLFSSYQKGNVIINEVLPSPKGIDSENEWIELKNLENKEISLFSWKLQDIEGKITSYSFSKDAKIPKNGFFVLKRKKSKIILQNKGDGLRLINPNKKIVDFLEYKEAPLNQSYNRTKLGWVWSPYLTPGKENKVSLEIKPVPKNNNNQTFLIAILLALFSSFIVLIIKKFDY